MNMHKAKRYTQVTCLTCVTAVNNCTRQMLFFPLSSSQEEGSEGEKKSNLMGTLFFFPLWMENQHTNDADTHAKRHKTTVAHTQADTRRYKYILPSTLTHTRRQSTSQNCMQTLSFFSKCISGEYSALLSHSFRVCCYLAEGLDMQTTSTQTLKQRSILKQNFNMLPLLSWTL